MLAVPQKELQAETDKFLRQIEMRHIIMPLIAVLAALLSNPLSASRAQGVFGNSPIEGTAFDFIADGGIAGGGAVSFTPVRNINLASVTVWLTGYTGLDMYGESNQSFYAGIYDDQTINEAGYASDQPGTLVASLDAPSPNDGSLSSFLFVNSATACILAADTKYWLFIYEATSGSHNDNNYPQWVQGNTPMGDAVYDGSQSFWAFTFSPASATPAFAINAVPEPATGALLGAGVLIWGAMTLRLGLLRQRSRGQ